MELVLDTELVKLWKGDCREVMATLPDCSVDAIVTDPPYELGFMGKGWDSSGIAFDQEVWAQAFRVLKPGGHALVFGGTRTWHRVAVAVEDAGFEVRDSIAWLYGSGFSKSWNFATRYDGAWCDCTGTNALPYNHASNPDLLRLREDLYAPAVACGEGEDPDLLASVQRPASGRGMEATREQGARGLDARIGSVVQGADAGRVEPGVEGRLIHRAGQGVSDDPSPRPSESAGERLRRGASAGDGRNDRSHGDAARRGASHQQGSRRQPAGEPEAVSGSHEPLDDGAFRGRTVCSRCGGLRPEYRGFGSSLKPAFEPVVVARKPLEGTVAANVIEHGTGALNIDASRIATGENLNRPHGENAFGIINDDSWKPNSSLRDTANNAGRFPSNVLLDESQAAALDEQSGTLTSGLMKARTERQPRLGGTIYGADKRNIVAGDTYADSGGASRFFYVAKAPAHERPEVDGTQHATVKPLTLMRYLVKLVTPPGGTVLEPFAGSGTTLEAALLEGFNTIGAELDHDGTHIPLIKQRLSKPLTPAMF